SASTGLLAPTQTVWYQLAPDSTGLSTAYVNGTFVSQSTMNTPRLYFPSAVLPDGRIFAIGGEYSPQYDFVNAPEIYNPLTNSWTRVAPMPSPPTSASQPGDPVPLTPASQFGDDPIAILTNGDIIAVWF